MSPRREMMVVSACCLYLSLSLLLFPSGSSADTHTAASCSNSDVQAAVNAASDGDMVSIPGGDCTWTASVVVDLASPARGLTIQGAGIGITNITNYGFDVSGDYGKNWRVTGMTLKGSAGFVVGGASKNWRIDHIYFDASTGTPGASGRLIWVQPSTGHYTSGVIDHCTFHHLQTTAFHYRDDQSSGGNSSWNRALGLGGGDAVYIEDCTFIYSSYKPEWMTTDCEGGRYVFRYNTVQDGYVGMHDAIVNGWRSCRKWEIYNNTFINSPGSGIYTDMAIRGGTGVVFNNTFTGAPDGKPIHLALYRTYQTGGNPWDVLCSNSSGKACLGSSSTYPQRCLSDANCGGKTGACIAIDNISGSPSGYPCRDQIGWDGNTQRTSRPSLFWNNQVDGVYTHPVVVSGKDYLVNGRDYCTGTSGMPSSCNGVASDYTPFPYPHPVTVEIPVTRYPNPPALRRTQ